MLTATHSVELALSSETLRQVHLAIDSGEFDSASEVVESALRSWNADRCHQNLSHDEKEKIGRMWDEALADPRPREEPEQVMEHVRAELRALYPAVR